MRRYLFHITRPLLIVLFWLTQSFAFASSVSSNIPRLVHDELPWTVFNGSFEKPIIGSNYQLGDNGTWTFTGYSGIQGNGSAFGAPAAPEGAQTAFLVNAATITSNHIQFTVGNKYMISFQAAQRGCCTLPYNQTIQVSVDGVLVGTAAPTSTSSFASFSFAFTATSSPHQITFTGTASAGDNAAFIDAVSVRPVPLEGNAALVNAKWIEFLSALNSGNTEAATQTIVSEFQEKYRQIFVAMGVETSNIAPNLSPLKFLSVTPTYVNALVTQQVLGESFIRPVTFVFRDGTWSLLSF